MSTIRASIVGVTGFTGLELLRLLRAHPRVALAHLTSRQDAGTPIDRVFPHLAPLPHLLTSPDYETLAADSDLVFLCLPHGTAQEAVAALHGRVKLIDLSADFRLDDADTYARYYGEHARPDLLPQVIYGAPEIVGRGAVARANTVANPGCFALLAQLMLHPFAGRIRQADVVAVTGSSGLGREARPPAHHATRTMRSYNINIHRHMAEITRTARIDEAQLNFLPTSGPFVRGIFATAFLDLAEPVAEPGATYAGDPFVRVVESVALGNVVGSNCADLSFAPGHGGRVLVQGALDNLVKGAAGAAVQNMNLMCALPETAGLDILAPVYP